MICQRSLIELVGINGSGKTTVAHALSERLRASGRTVRLEDSIFSWTKRDDAARGSWMWKLFRDNSLAAALRRPLLYLWMMVFAARIRPFTIKNIQYAILILGWIRLTASGLNNRASLDEVNVQDEGAFHLLTRLAMYGDQYSAHAFERVVRQIARAMPRILVVVDPGSVEAAMRRQASRQGMNTDGTFRLQRSGEMNFRDAVALRERHQAAVEAIFRTLSAVAGQVVVKCNNDGRPIEENVTRIMDAWQASRLSAGPLTTCGVTMRKPCGAGPLVPSDRQEQEVMMSKMKAILKPIIPEPVRQALYNTSRDRGGNARRKKLLSALKSHVRYEGALYEPVSIGGEINEGKRDWKERWRMIRQVLEDCDAGSLLDVGCAEGWLLRKAAEEKGCFALGIELDDRRLFRGEVSRIIDGGERYATMKARLSPSNIVRLPQFDVVLCLSVVHHVIRAEGLEGGRAFLRALATRVQKAIVFEMGTREEHEMSWQETMPEMPEGQEAFMTSYLESAGFKNVRALGTTPSLKHEASRVLLVAEPGESVLDQNVLTAAGKAKG